MFKFINLSKWTIALIVFYLCSCNYNIYKDRELEALNDVMKEIVHIDYGRIPVKPPLFSMIDSITYFNKLNAYKARMDTVNKIIYVSDTMNSLSKEKLSRLISTIEKMIFILLNF